MAAAFLRLATSASALMLAACGAAGPPAADADSSPDASVSSTAEPTASAEQPAMTLPVRPDDPADCNVPEAAVFAGRRATAEVRAELAAAVAPVTAIRWVGPGDATTEDYNPERLNVMLDVGGTIISAHCG